MFGLKTAGARGVRVPGTPYITPERIRYHVPGTLQRIRYGVPGTLPNGAQYQAVYTNGFGTATTIAVTLTVDYSPTVTSNPTSITVNAGQSAIFMASASNGNPTPTTVQWQVNTGSGFTNLSNSGSTVASPQTR